MKSKTEIKSRKIDQTHEMMVPDRLKCLFRSCMSTIVVLAAAAALITSEGSVLEYLTWAEVTDRSKDFGQAVPFSCVNLDSLGNPRICLVASIADEVDESKVMSSSRLMDG